MFKTNFKQPKEPKKKKRKKRTPYQIAKKKAWHAFSRYIRLKYANDDGMIDCITCGKRKHWKEMQAGHFIQGRGSAILFDERGVHPQCYGCNICKSGNLIPYYEFMLKQYGPEVIADLKKAKENTVKFNIKDLEKWTDEWNLIADEMEKEING